MPKYIMIGRRRLLGTLLSLGGLAALLSACKHRAPYSQTEEPGTEDDGRGGGGGY